MKSSADTAVCHGFYPQQRVSGSAVPAACRRRREWPSRVGGIRHDMAWGVPPPGGGGKRGKTTKVFFPLLTPQIFLRTRLPAVARLKSGGPQGRLVLQENALDGSGVFRSANQALCTGWPRTVMRGALRKENSGPNSVPKSVRRTEPSPVSPVSPRDRRESRRKGGFEGVKRGQGNHTVPLPPFAPRRGHGVPRR